MSHDVLRYGSGTEKTVLITLRKEIATYERMRGDLELDHHGEWVVCQNESMIDAYDSF